MKTKKSINSSSTTMEITKDIFVADLIPYFKTYSEIIIDERTNLNLFHVLVACRIEHTVYNHYPKNKIVRLDVKQRVDEVTVNLNLIVDEIEPNKTIKFTRKYSNCSFRWKFEDTGELIFNYCTYSLFYLDYIFRNTENELFSGNYVENKRRWYSNLLLNYKYLNQFDDFAGFVELTSEGDFGEIQIMPYDLNLVFEPSDEFLQINTNENDVQFYSKSSDHAENSILIYNFKNTQAISIIDYFRLLSYQNLKIL